MLIGEDDYKELLDCIVYYDLTFSSNAADEAARNFSIVLRKIIELEDWDALLRLAEDIYSMEKFERHYFYERGRKEAESETLRTIASQIPKIDAFAASLNESKGGVRMAVYFDKVVKYPSRGGNVMVVFDSGENVVNGYARVAEEMVRRNMGGACNGRRISEISEWQDMYLHLTGTVSAGVLRYEMSDNGWVRLDEGVLITEETFK